MRTNSAITITKKTPRDQSIIVRAVADVPFRWFGYAIRCYGDFPVGFDQLAYERFITSHVDLEFYTFDRESLTETLVDTRHLPMIREGRWYPLGQFADYAKFVIHTWPEMLIETDSIIIAPLLFYGPEAWIRYTADTMGARHDDVVPYPFDDEGREEPREDA